MGQKDFSVTVMANPLTYFSFNSILHGGIRCIALVSILWLIWRRYFSRSSGVPLPGLKTPPYSILGSMYTFPSTKLMKKVSLPFAALALQTFSAHWKFFENEKLFCFNIGPGRLVFLRKPEAVQELLKSNNLISKSSLYNFLVPWLGTGLLTSSGPKWRSRRKLLSAAFHFDILKDFLPTINTQSKIFIDILKQRVHEKFVDVTPLIVSCSLDIICASILGVDVGAQRNSESEYVEAVLRTTQTITERMLSPHLWLEIVFRMSTRGRQFQKDIKTLHEFTKMVIRQKQTAFRQCLKELQVCDTSCPDPRRRRKALMDLLIEHQMKYHDITEEDIREEVDTFVFEGHDTTAVGLSWTIYLIGLYPEVQAKLHEEIDDIYGDDIESHITQEDIRKMLYLDCVLKESQRLYPSIPGIGRQVEEDQDFCGYRIKKGDTLLVYSYLLHRDSESFPNPEKFDPDRFLPENSSGRHPFAYIPFSAGARNCIGQRFALMEEKVIMANVLRNFNVKSLDQRDKIIVTPEVTLRPYGPLRLQFIPRTTTLGVAS